MRACCIFCEISCPLSIAFFVCDRRPPLRWRDCLCSLGTPISSPIDFGEQAGMLCALAVWSIIARRCGFRLYDIYLTMEPCSRTVPPLHGISLSWSHNLCAVHPLEIFTLPGTFSSIVNRIISEKLRSDWKTRKIVEIYVKGCVRSLIEE